MNKKGFTLIELLAVIVILAIIALIATPIITGIVANVKKGGAESSALGWIDAVEKQSMVNMLDDNSTILTDGTYNVSDLDIKVKGEKPKSGWVKIEQGQVKDYSLVIGEYTVTPKDNNPSKAVAVKGSSKYPSVVYSNATGGTHVGYPIDAGQDLGSKYVRIKSGFSFPFNSLEECNERSEPNEQCVAANFTTPNLDYKTSPDASWNFYLKYTLNSSGIIEEIDVCGKHNGKEFCLKRNADDSKFEQNKTLLLNTFGNDSCNVDSSIVSCADGSFGAIATLDARGRGLVFVEDGDKAGCAVYDSGTAVCMDLAASEGESSGNGSARPV